MNGVARYAEPGDRVHHEVDEVLGPGYVDVALPEVRD